MMAASDLLATITNKTPGNNYSPMRFKKNKKSPRSRGGINMIKRPGEMITSLPC